MNKVEITARLEAIDKELLPLFEKKGKRGPEIERMLKLESESELLSAKLRSLERKEMLADPMYLAELEAKHGPIKKMA